MAKFAKDLKKKVKPPLSSWKSPGPISLKPDLWCLYCRAGDHAFCDAQEMQFCQCRRDNNHQVPIEEALIVWEEF